MPIARSKITAQGQISVPSHIRQKLGVGPGSTLEWNEEDGKIVVRRSGRFSSEDIHRAIFSDGAPKSHTADEMNEGIRSMMRQRHARR